MQNEQIIKKATECLEMEASAIMALIPRLNEDFLRAVQLIRDCKGKIVVTGVGKSGHIGSKIAATLASTGTPAFFLNPLDAYHVPLIIWSPLLEKTARFDVMVSHNDITPSMLTLLRDNFGLETPKTVSWVSDGLDTVSGFHSNVRNYFLHYSRELRDFVWNDYYYTMDDKQHPVSRIIEGVKLKNMLLLRARETDVSYIIFQFSMPQVQCQKSHVKVIGFHMPYL